MGGFRKDGTCRKGLHDVDAEGAVTTDGRCRPCRRSNAVARGRARDYAKANARQRIPEVRMERQAKRRASARWPTELAAAREYYWAHRADYASRYRARRLREALEGLGKPSNKSYLDGRVGEHLTKQQKLERLAAQTESPNEAAIARQKLTEIYGVA